MITAIAIARGLLLSRAREIRRAVGAPEGCTLGLVRKPGGWRLLWRSGEAHLGANGAAALEALRTLAGVPDPVEPTAAGARQRELM